MRLRLIVVGKGAAELAGFEARFADRLAAYADFSLLQLPEGRGKQAAQRKQQEGKAILNKAAPGFVLFDERGRHMDSVQWSEFLGRQPGNARLDFVIGGADGVDGRVRAAAGDVRALSKLTLPHQLARVLVLEQLYRAFTLLAGHPYHRP